MAYMLGLRAIVIRERKSEAAHEVVHHENRLLVKNIIDHEDCSIAQIKLSRFGWDKLAHHAISAPGRQRRPVPGNLPTLRGRNALLPVVFPRSVPRPGSMMCLTA